MVDEVTHVANPEQPLWTDREGAPRIEFELEQVFGAEGGPSDAILGDPYALYVAVGESGRVYVLDGQAEQFVAFGPDGRVRWRTGRSGDGPGEFSSPAEIAMAPDGTLAVLNASRTRVALWDEAGTFRTQIALTHLPIYTFLAGFVAPDNLVLYRGIPGGAGSEVGVVDLSDGTLRSGFEWRQVDVAMPRNVSSEASVRATPELITVGSGSGYRFRLYSADGELRHEVTRAVDYPVRSGVLRDEVGEGIASFGEVLAPMPLATGYLLVAVSWTKGIADPDEEAARRIRALRARRPPPPLDRASSYDLFDREGRLLYSLVDDSEGNWPATGIPQLIGPDNRLYTIAETPFPQIRRYRVIVR